MKIKSVAIVLMGGASMLLSSCVTDAGVWGASVSYSTPGFSSSVAWTNASYDADGFPIYGYAYGRPVYGYTSAGVAIYSISALTAWCYVPNWRPAPWYHGPHHHPHHCHHAPAPPKHDHGHHPGRRPEGGLHAPIHKNPSSVLGKPVGHNGRPSHGSNHVSAGRPNGNRPGNTMVNRPNGNRPGNNMVNRPNMSRPNNNAISHPSNNAMSRPSMSRPNNNAMSRPSISRPSNNAMSRPSGHSGGRPNMGGGGRSGGGGRHR